MFAAAMGNGVVLLVHGKCADGRTSAGLLLRKFPGAEVRGIQPAGLLVELRALAPRKDLTRLVIADLSPQSDERDATRGAIAPLAARIPVSWLDHHAPQWPVDFEKSLRDWKVEVRLDRTETESGASLVAAWTGEKDAAVLRVADLIRKRDAWVEPHDPAARAWTLVASDLDDYEERLRSGNLEGLEELGQRLLVEKETSIKRSLDQVQRHTPSVAFLWGEQDLSDVADRLFMEDSKVVFLLRFGPSARVSIRSRPERAVAATLGQAFGGGGHAHAAGFSFRIGWWRRLVYRLRRARDPLVGGALAKAVALAA